MEIKERIQLDLAKLGPMLEIHAKQGDDAARFVEVELLENGVAYAIPEGASAYFRCRKPDGHSCYNPAAISNEDGTILVELTAQVLAVPGPVLADVVLEGDGVLSAFSFIIQVEAAPLGDLAESRDELGRYEDQLAQIGTAIEDVQAAVEDLQASAEGTLEQRLRAKSIRVTNFPATEPPSITVGVVREDDSAVAYVVNLGANGYPAEVTVKHGADSAEDSADDWECVFAWEGFE
ncbi:MAG: BppU family phage baseplate upper protein [Oscillospiraceae bacterium]|nr:BppU family phage baseplate upper protein [Oscillospiraceae bacterium]